MNDDLLPDDDALLRAGRRALRELPDAPEWLVLRANAIWQTPPQTTTPPLLTRLLAVLSFDSWASPAPALRGSAAPGARQWLFSAEGRDVDLRIAATGNTWSIEGHVLGPDEGGSAEVETPGQPAQLAALDDLGAFRFDGLAAGTCRVTLRFADVLIELPALELGSFKADG